MKLKHTLLLGALVHALDGAMAIPTYAQSQWEYIVDAADGTLYFGKDIKTFDGITFMRTKKEADPDGRNGVCKFKSFSSCLSCLPCVPCCVCVMCGKW